MDTFSNVSAISRFDTLLQVKSSRRIEGHGPARLTIFRRLVSLCVVFCACFVGFLSRICVSIVNLEERFWELHWGSGGVVLGYVLR